MTSEVFKKNRKKLGLTQDQLAEKIGVSKRTVQNYENGEVIPKSKFPILNEVFFKEKKIYQYDKIDSNLSESKVVSIVPFDDEIKLLADAIYILNEFKTKGYSRKSFIDYVSGLNSKYNNLEGFRLLDRFWACRLKQEDINQDLLKILNK